MAGKNRRYFYLLTYFFLAFTVLVLLLVWGFSANQRQGAGMMGQSMGNMMLSMHGGDVTLSSTVMQTESSESGAHESHHSGTSDFGHYWTTSLIIFCLPWILAGAAFLLVYWFKL
jgi:hypothetical protein